MSGASGHGEDYRHYRKGISYFKKNLANRIYVLGEAARSMLHGDITAEELEELAKLAFPGWEGDGDG